MATNKKRLLTLESIASVKNNTSVMTPDEDGYYTIILGSINVFSVRGEYYEGTKEVLALFDKSSLLQTRIKDGILGAEAGHPMLEPGMTKEAYSFRLNVIKESNVCAHIKEVWLVETDEASGRGSDKKIRIMGKVRPETDWLKDRFKNPKANIAFSIRAPFVGRIEGGILVKWLTSIITWDFVTEAGLPGSTKFKTMGLESGLNIAPAMLMEVSDADIMDDGPLAECFNCTLEGSNTIMREFKSVLQREVDRLKEDDSIASTLQGW